MELSVYLMVATIATFAVGAALSLWASIATGQWKHLDRAALSVLDDDDPMPTHAEGAR